MCVTVLSQQTERQTDRHRESSLSLIRIENSTLKKKKNENTGIYWSVKNEKPMGQVDALSLSLSLIQTHAGLY